MAYTFTRQAVIAGVTTSRGTVAMPITGIAEDNVWQVWIELIKIEDFAAPYGRLRINTGVDTLFGTGYTVNWADITHTRQYFRVAVPYKAKTDFARVTLVPTRDGDSITSVALTLVLTSLSGTPYAGGSPPTRTILPADCSTLYMI